MMIIRSTDGDTGFFSNIKRIGSTASKQGDFEPIKRSEPFGSVLRGKTDIIEISSEKSEGSVSTLKETKKNILGGISRDADPVTLDGLKARIEAGTYSISPDELARILSE